MLTPAQLLAQRANLKTGTLIYVRRPFRWHRPMCYESLAIRKVLKSEYNHIAICWEFGGILFVVEAVGGKEVAPVPLELWLQRRQDQIFALADSDAQELEIVKHFGKLYDTAGALNQLWLWLFGKWYGRANDRAQEKLICIEFIALVLHVSNYYRATFRDLPQPGCPS
jgi:hypothetical protein